MDTRTGGTEGQDHEGRSATRARTSSCVWKVTRECPGHGLECGVAGVMPEALIQLGHVTDVEVEDLHGGALVVGPLEEVGARHDEAPPVLEAGQVVDP